MMTRQARPSAKINGFDTHMILEAVPAQPSERPNGHQAINQTSRHYAEALGQRLRQIAVTEVISARFMCAVKAACPRIVAMP
jgi:hypothetical protein